MAKGFGDSKRKKKLDSRDIFLKKEKLENYFKPAVITPGHITGIIICLKA